MSANIKIKKHISLNLEICMSHDISYPEWILCEQIQFLSVRKGYCYAKRKTLAEALKISVRGLQKMIDRMMKKGLILRLENNALVVTEKWLEFQEIKDQNHEQSSPQIRTKFTPRYEQSSPPTIKIDNLKVEIEEKKQTKKKNAFDDFVKIIEELFEANRILTHSEKINKTNKTKKYYKLIHEDDLFIVANEYTKYVKRNKSKAVRLDKYLLARYENNLYDIEYGVEKKLNKEKPLSEKIEEWNREDDIFDAEVV